jgi:hypothetical protein
MRHDMARDWIRRLDNPRVAAIIVIGLILSLAVMSGPARLRAASTVIAVWSAVSPGFGGMGGAGEFRNISAASTGFTSVPTARALIKAPRWVAAVKTAVPAGAQTASSNNLALAVVGLPVDVQHEMLRNTKLESFCLAPQSADQGTFSLCKDAKQLYGSFADCRNPKNQTEENICYDKHLASSVSYNLCDFDEDCWHSTAVSIVAVGSRTQQNVFARPGQQARAEFRDNTFLKLARADYKEFSESQEEGDGKTSFKDFMAGRFPGFDNILNVTMPIAVIPYAGYATKKTYITRGMIVDHGIHPGGPLLAVNVFSRFESAVECDAHQKLSPCVLTTMAAQEEALRQILSRVAGPEPGTSAANAPSSLGAIVIVAGGELTERRCDDTPTAKLISGLRSHGVLTFVPVGNDGDPAKVRFPACASAAVSIGSLTRDGAIADFSNGSKTGMVALYVDGETVVLPIRGPRFLGNTEGPIPVPRTPRDQYDAYLAGGTLLGAAVASGVFLNLRERHPTLSTEALLDAFKANRSSTRPPFSEISEQAAEQTIASHAGQN